jgi:hypothetical protein
MNWLSKLLSNQGPMEPAERDEWVDRARSHNGYEREAAVKALARSADTAVLPALLERSNDWVPQVRRAAQEGLRAFLRSEHVAGWAPALGQVAALHRAGRSYHSALIDEVEAFLCSPGHLAKLATARAGLSREATRFLVRLQLRAAAGNDAEHCDMLCRLVLDNDVFCASQAVHAIATLASPAHRLAVVRAACGSRFAAVRASALRTLLREQIPDVAGTLVNAMCSDPSRTVRTIVLASPAMDRERATTQARRALQADRSASERAAALDLLCDLDPASARALCEEARTDPATALRRIAYAQLLARSQADERDRWALLALQDRSPKVRRLAVARIREGATPPDAPVLLQIAHDHPPALGSVASIAAHLSPWVGLDLLLQLLRKVQAAPTAAHALHAELDRWTHNMARCFVQPAPEQAQVIRHEWSCMQGTLPPDLESRLATHLSGFGVLNSPAV